MIRPRRLFLASVLGTWVSLVLACGGVGEQTQRPKSEPTAVSDTVPAKPTKAPPGRANSARGTPRTTNARTGVGSFARTGSWRSRARKGKAAAAEASLEKAKATIAATKAELTRFETKYKDSLREPLTRTSHNDRKTAVAKAEEAEKAAVTAVQDSKARRSELEKNDPPYFDGPFAGCQTVQDLERRVAEQDTEKYAAEVRRKEEAARQRAEAARLKAEEEYDNNGLVFLRKTTNGTSGQFGGEVTGTVVNRRAKKLRYVQITFILYDASGAQVGTALANINDLEPGARWNFKATSFGTKFDTYKFSELSGF